MKRTLYVLFAAALVVGATQAAPTAPTAPVNPEVQQQMQRQAQLKRARTIRHRLVTLSNYGVFDSLSFAIDGETVTLSGFASRPSLKKSAERTLSKVEGVKRIENQIEVLPLSRHDDDVRRQVYVNIYGHPLLSRYNPQRGLPYGAEAQYRAGFGNSRFAPPLSVAEAAGGVTYDPAPGAHPIHIIVENGKVTLVGVVDTEGEKTIAGLQATTTSDVFEMVNNLVVADRS